MSFEIGREKKNYNYFLSHEYEPCMASTPCKLNQASSSYRKHTLLYLLHFQVRIPYIAVIMTNL